MNAHAILDFSDRLPNEVEMRNAEELRSVLAKVVSRDAETELSLAFGKGEARNITLAPALAFTMLEVLRLVASGRGFRMIPVDAELTTQQAADLLNVSRPYLIKMLEEGQIAFKKIGRHRRIRAEDLFFYKATRDEEREKALADMATLDVELGLI